MCIGAAGNRSNRQKRLDRENRNTILVYDSSTGIPLLGSNRRHRFAQTADGEPGLSYLCDAYREIFSYMGPYLNVMAKLIQAGRPAAGVMKIVGPQGLRKEPPSPGRNRPCPCGSGRKYKRCCGA